MPLLFDFAPCPLSRFGFFFLNANQGSPLASACSIVRQFAGTAVAYEGYAQTLGVKTRLNLILEVRKLGSLQVVERFRKSGGPCAYSPD
jgi:hypothetical protein